MKNETNEAGKVSKTIIGNNTGADIREYDKYFAAVVRDGVALPEELADLFTVTVIEVEDGRRGIVNWA